MLQVLSGGSVPTPHPQLDHRRPGHPEGLDCCPASRRPEDSIPEEPRGFLLGNVQRLTEPGSCSSLLDTVQSLHRQQLPKQTNFLSVSKPGTNQSSSDPGGDQPNTISYDLTSVGLFQKESQLDTLTLNTFENYYSSA